MICEEICEELVAYHDGELSAEDRTRVATHLSSCTACSQEAAQLKQLSQLFAKIEPITPSPDFTTTFWKKLEQEKRSPASTESRLRQWWKTWRESFPRWQMVPAFVGAAAIVIFLGDRFSERISVPSKSANTTQVRKLARQDQPAQPEASAKDVPEQLQKELGLFVNYNEITDFDKLSHFDEIAAIALPQEPPVNIAESDIPQDVLAKPTFFADYPILQKMEQLQNLETVLDIPVGKDDKNHG